MFRRTIPILVVCLMLVAATAARAGDFPKITGFSPTGGPVGTLVTIAGSGFIGTTRVRFNGVSAQFTVDTAKRILATVPLGATTGKIDVKKPLGTATSADDFVVGPGSGPPPSSSSWPQFQHDAQRTGKSGANGPSGSSVNLAWQYKSVSWIKNQTSIADDGTIYIGDSKFPLCSLKTGGSLEWCTNVGGFVDQSSPAIGNPFLKTDAQGSRTVDTIYIGDRNNIFWAIDEDGVDLWHFKVPLDGDVRQSPLLGPAPQSRVYAMCGCTVRGVVYAFDPNGTLVWSVDLPLVRDMSPAGIMFGGHFRIYVITNNGKLFAIDDLGATGAIAWSLQLGATALHTSPSIGADGTIYVGTAAGVYAVKDNGTSGAVKPGWPFATSGGVDTAAAINGGKIYLSSYNVGTRTLYAIDATTNPPHVLWSLSGPGSSTTNLAQTPSPVIGANGFVYAAIGADIYGFDPAMGGTPKWHYQLPADAISLSIGNGALYVAAKDAMLYALTSP
ncbi:MAG TPA: PQQ-binding-like beta-propeller repeat protein [Candidatus Binatia bacterium]|nr:PQQ-binding-like beta-propeller repeat protein [Candidatus Binatia bacterium]